MIKTSVYRYLCIFPLHSPFSYVAFFRLFVLSCIAIFYFHITSRLISFQKDSNKMTAKHLESHWPMERVLIDWMFTLSEIYICSAWRSEDFASNKYICILFWRHKINTLKIWHIYFLPEMEPEFFQLLYYIINIMNCNKWSKIHAFTCTWT